MDGILVWVAGGFVAGVIFGMTMAASVFERRTPPPQPPPVVYMDTYRTERLQDQSNGCLTFIFIAMLLVGAVAALVVLGS